MTKHIAVPWFEPAGWERLKAIVGGRMCDYDEFLRRTGEEASGFKARGLVVDFKTIDASHFIAQCEARVDSFASADGRDVRLCVQQFDSDLFYVRDDTPPHHRSTPRHSALFDRHIECMRVQQQKWRACWEDGKLVRELGFDGVEFERLHHLAVDAHGNDQLDLCERLLDEMEQMMMRQASQ